MKSLTLFLILFMIESSVPKNALDNYSIDIFIIKLQNEGIFDLIVKIKELLGKDIAIITCEELNQNKCGKCKEVVIDYIPDVAASRRHHQIFDDEDEDEDKDKDKNNDKDKDKDKNKDKDDHSHPSSIDIKTNIENILKEKYAPNVADYFSDQIIKRAQQLNINI